MSLLSYVMEAVEIAGRVNRGELRPVEVVEEALARIAARDGELRAFREVWPERAREVARSVDPRLPLAGVPLGVKASERLDSPQVRRLVAAGCVPVGATSVPLAGATSWQTWGHTDRGPTVNPWRGDRTPGGSSAGSAAAVAAGLVPLATGIDGAGSVRIPAAWCGVVGVKVTNPDPLKLTAPGPLAGSVRDAAAYLGVELGDDAAVRAVWSADLGVELGDDAAVRAVWSADLGFADVDGRIVAVARAGADRLSVTRVEHPLVLRDPADAWFALRRAGDAAGEGDADGEGDAAGGAAAGRARAEEIRADNARRLAALFAVADVLLTPTAPGTPHGHDGPGDTMNVALTWAFNLSGHPAVSVPVGVDHDGVPVGLQIVGRPGAEATILRVAAMIQPGLSRGWG